MEKVCKADHFIKLNMASRSSGKYTLWAKPLEPSSEVLEDDLDSENDREGE